MDTGVHSFRGFWAARVRCVKRRVAWVCVGVASVCWGEEAAFKPSPAWDVAEAPCRLMVDRAQDAYVLVSVPVAVSDKPVAAVRAFEAGSEVAVRVVWTDASAAMVLVDAHAAEAGKTLRIYPVPGEKRMAAGGAVPVDPTPLRGCARRTAGMDFPTNLVGVQTLETRCDTPPVWFAVEDFNKLGATFKSWFKGDWTRKSHLVDLQTWLLVPSDGKYQFGLAGVAPAWMLLDGAPVFTHPAGKPYDAWTSSSEIPIKAGLRRLQVRTVCRQEIDTGIAWKRVGEAGVATNVTMVTGGDLRTGRWEWRDRRVQPFATVASGSAYRFAGVKDVFVPLTLTDGSACWGTNHVAHWEIGNRKIGDGASLAVTVRSSLLPARLALRAQAASGEEGVFETQVSYDGPVWAEYEVTSRVTGVPAACYPDDRVQPIVRIRTSAGNELAYELTSEIQWTTGKTTNRVDSIATDKGWARVYIGEFEAGSVSRVTWTLRHAGAEISRGRAEFLREPFSALPDAVSGESLKAGDAFVVLVASKASRGELASPSAADGTTNAVVFLDGFVYGGQGGSAAAGSGKAPWRRVDLRVFEQEEAASGMSLLQPLAAVKGFLPAPAVVLAPSLLGVSREGGTAGFERRLAALTGLLAGPASGRPRVLLVVPPAFDVLAECGCVPSAKPCVHAAAARDYAETVMRVADAHGVETVDLFTAFRTVGKGTPLVRNGVLTPEGVALAESLIEKKLAARD